MQTFSLPPSLPYCLITSRPESLARLRSHSRGLRWARLVTVLLLTIRCWHNQSAAALVVKTTCCWSVILGREFSQRAWYRNSGVSILWGILSDAFYKCKVIPKTSECVFMFQLVFVSKEIKPHYDLQDYLSSTWFLPVIPSRP